MPRRLSGADLSANTAKCWNWFSAGDQRRDQGEPSLIAGITRQVMRDYAVEPRRVYVAGLSAGGAAAAIMGATYPDLYAAIGVHSGLACGAAQRHAVRLRRDAAGRGRCAPARHGLRGGSGLRCRRSCFMAIRTAPSIRATAIWSLPRRSPPPLRSTRREPAACPADIAYSRTLHADPSGQPMFEQWVIHGAGHAWFGGSPPAPTPIRGDLMHRGK